MGLKKKKGEFDGELLGTISREGTFHVILEAVCVCFN